MFSLCSQRSELEGGSFQRTQTELYIGGNFRCRYFG